MRLSPLMRQGCWRRKGDMEKEALAVFQSSFCSLAYTCLYGGGGVIQPYREGLSAASETSRLCR